MTPSFLAQVPPQPVQSWAPVVLLIVIAVGFAVANVARSIFVGPKRTGPGKEETYESGMVPIGDARKRFNVRFYIVAMIFLVFDVEIVFFYPWASIFASHVQEGAKMAADGVPNHNGLLLLAEIILFVIILLVSYFYAWGKGVFRWD